MSRSDCPRRFCSHPRVLCGRAFGIYYSGAPHLPTCSESTRAQAAVQAACFHLLGRQRSRSSRMQGVRSSCCSGVHSSARRCVISAAVRRDVCAAKTRPAEVRRRRLLAGPRRLVPHCLLPKTRGCAGFGPKGLPLAQGPAAGRAGASRRETPATAAHRPFAALPKHARLGASAFTRGSPISSTPSFER